jgi:hypothetical protein
MTRNQILTRPPRHYAWNILGNPIFRRYCRSRLRPVGLIAGVVVAVVIAGFIFALTRSLAIFQARLDPVDAERTVLIPLLVFQSLILFVGGTAQVAGGMVAERDEGVIDYQRLIPMSPLSKVLGYLFGLPIREYVMFASTLPFTLWALWQGKVEMAYWLPLYGVLMSSTLLYHFTGLLTGTVVKSRRWAFLASIGLVFCLYTVFPQVAKFGLVFFKYLTITPVFQEQLPGLLPRSAQTLVEKGQQFLPNVKFFKLSLSETAFTLFSQGGLILTFTVMLCRKWKSAESHLLNKGWALGFFIWIQALLLGNALPLVEQGKLFPSRELSRYVGISPTWRPAAGEAVAMSAVYGFVTLVIIYILASIVTPSHDKQSRGWRRARKHGGTSLPVLSDAATSFWCVLLMALAGAVGWFLFTRGVIESRWFPGHVVSLPVLGYYSAVLLTAGIGYQALLEWKGARGVWLAALLLGVVPLMAGAVLSASAESLQPLAAWIAAASPLSLPIFAPSSVLSLADLPGALESAAPSAFKVWLPVLAIAAAAMAWRLRVFRSTMAISAADAAIVTSPPAPASDEGYSSS